MARNIIGVVTGLAAWLAIAFLAALIMRGNWPAYASVADAMTFTLPMMLARLAIGAFATIVAGFVTACITRSTLARLLPGVLLLIFFIPDHVQLWDKFPIWYHLWFLLSLVPLTYVGNAATKRALRDSALTPA
jgi:hypothetical protein